jgi:hypothetical protein
VHKGQLRKIWLLPVLCLLVAKSHASEPAAEAEQEALIKETLSEEAAPAAEPPYPATNETPSTPAAAREPAEQVQRPIKIDEEGNYIYSKDEPAPTPSGHPDVVQPKATTPSGEFIYETDKPKTKFSQRPDVEAPVNVLQNGEFQYHLEEGVSTKSGSFRFGAMTPPAIKNSRNGLTFANIYGANPMPLVIGDYELMRLSSRAGRLVLKFNTGVATAYGPGHFADPSRSAEKPIESYNIFIMPNAITGHYRFQFSEKQFFVPFLEGGAGYYTVWEMRDDSKSRVGGGAVAVAAGGFNLLMDKYDPRALRELSTSYNINHIWLTVEGRGSLGLGSTLDFTSFTGDVGFMLEF